MRFERPQQLIGIRECGAARECLWEVTHCAKTSQRTDGQHKDSARNNHVLCKEQSRTVTKQQAKQQVTYFVLRLCFLWVSEQATIISLCSI